MAEVAFSTHTISPSLDIILFSKFSPFLLVIYCLFRATQAYYIFVMEIILQLIVFLQWYLNFKDGAAPWENSCKLLSSYFWHHTHINKHIPSYTPESRCEILLGYQYYFKAIFRQVCLISQSSSLRKDAPVFKTFYPVLLSFKWIKWFWREKIRLFFIFEPTWFWN